MNKNPSTFINIFQESLIHRFPKTMKSVLIAYCRALNALYQTEHIVFIKTKTTA